MTATAEAGRLAGQGPLNPEELARIDAYWRAANYLSVGQIYLLDNPLLREPLRLEHVKPRLLGHWGTTPGLNFIYVHMNRAIKNHDLDAIYITGPGHGGPGVVANTYLEGVYSEIYPDVSGEAETGPLAASWHSNKFLNPVHDGAVLPILHLNGYKIANPTVLARIPREELVALLRGYGHEPYVVEGDEPADVHRQLAEMLDTVVAEIREIQRRAREEGETERPRWPAIVLVTPKGWTGPGEGSWRSHQVPLADVHHHPERLGELEAWLRSYRPEELFDEQGRLVPELRALAPEGDRRMGANPHANGGLLLRDLRLPDFRDYAVDVPRPGGATGEATRVMGAFLRDVARLNEEARNFRLFAPDELASNRLDAVFEVTDRAWNAERLETDDHRARGPGDGDPQRAHLPGLARGVPADRPLRAVRDLRGVRPRGGLDVQPARE